MTVRVLKTVLAASLLTLALAGSARADDFRRSPPPSRRDPPGRHSIPEFDPAAAGAVAAVLAGGGLFIARARRNKK